jgi:DNA-directed RNA polymerase subunit RPC12/RpoP
LIERPAAEPGKEVDMKIYDKRKLKWRSILDYGKDKSPQDYETSLLIETDKVLDVGTVFIKDKIAYTINSIRKQEWAIAERLPIQEVFVLGEHPKDKYYTDNITCPYCGYEDCDSWEAEDDEEQCECGNCGSIFSYQRKVTVEYCSQPVKKVDVVCFD